MKAVWFFTLTLLLFACGNTTDKEEMEMLTSEVDAMLEGEPIENAFDHHFGLMPDGGIKIKINPVGGTLAQVFNDSNHLHLEVAKELGIKPMTNISDVWSRGHKLVKITSCPEYFVEKLTHSVPFLVPEAKELLTEIGSSFNDSLEARGGGDYRIKVTSVTRTPVSVTNLKRSNINASDNSAHQYGTTFDISYAKFICDTPDTPRTQEDLKNLLAEVLKEQQDLGHCYVKYERKQGCFHITLRPKSEWKKKNL